VALSTGIPMSGNLAYVCPPCFFFET
jgi:hypothetical protein